MWVARKRRHVIEFGEGDIGAVQRRDRIEPLEPRKGFGDHPIGFGAVADARHIADKAGVLHEIPIDEDFDAEFGPFPIALDGD